MDTMQGKRRGNFTLAPEAASEKVRQSINKPISDEDLFSTVEKIFQMGWKNLKLYFMIGFPGEDLEDVQKIPFTTKEELRKSGNKPILSGKTLGMVFQKPSLRTRVSFEVGMLQLGGHALYLSPNEIGLGKRESIADVARVLSGYVQALMARVFEHEHVLELAKWLQRRGWFGGQKPS